MQLHLDPLGGAAGDMFAAAMLDAFPQHTEAAVAAASSLAPVSCRLIEHRDGLFAGWLIALMVWLLPASGSARPLIILLLTYTVSLGKLSHIIAGSSEAAFAVIAGGAPWADYLSRFLLPTLIGNTIGGVLLVAIVNHAQVTSELEATPGGRKPQPAD